MLNWLRDLVSPPIFDDEEKTRISQFMNAFSWIAIGVVVFLIVSRNSFWVDSTSIPTYVLFYVIVVLLATQFLVRRGYVFASSILAITNLWMAMTLLSWFADGLHDVAVNSYFVIILLASLLLGWKAAAIFGVSSVIMVWIFAFMEKEGLRPVRTDDPLSYARDLTGVFFLVGTLTYLLIHGWSRTLRSAKTDLNERLRAEKKLQEQADYLTVLHETALSLLNRSELKPLLESILARACDLLNTPHGLIELVLPDETALRQEVGRGHLAQYIGSTAQRNQGVSGTTWVQGKTIVIQNYQEWEGAIPEFVAAGFKAVMGVPLIVENRVIGVLSASYLDEKRTFSAQQVNLMERFAALAALAIHNTRLNEKIQSDLHERSLIELALRASEERFRKIFQASPVAICITSLDEGRLLDANSAYWAMSGYDPNTSIGKSHAELGMWESEKARQDFISRIKVQHSIYNPNYEFTTPSNEHRSAIAFYELIELNNQACVLSMFHDITAQRQAEIALRESESRISAVLSAIPDMIFEIKNDGTLIGFVPSSEINPLLSPEDFLGKNIKDTLSESIAAQTMFAVQRAISSNQLHAFEYNLPSSGEARTFEARVAPLSSETAIIMVRDISQRKWVETEREGLINELEEKNAELERFTYTVSHDLKSPLITIKGFLGFVEQDAANGNMDRLKKDIQRISDATEKMQSLLNELLELSRVGRLMNPYEYVEFEDLANEAIELVQGRLLNASVKVRIQKDLPRVFGDRKRLVETLQNLVDNAAKFTGNNPTPLIEIGQDGSEDGKPIFFVRDNGIGIAPEHHDRIFGLFNKLDGNSDGTGIGLALVKRIVEVHNGRIWVQSEAGKGSTFFFTLQTGPATDS
jgi:PAS domain S-box-containing protein